VIFCSSWKDYFSFERSKKSLVYNSILAISCVFFLLCTPCTRKRFDLRFSIHFLSILIVIDGLFKLPSSLLLCVSCVHCPLEEI
jgi:hypothetical protein